MDFPTIISSAATAVTAGVVGVFWLDIKAFKRDQEKVVAKIQASALQKTEHVIVCENNTLKVTNRIDLLEQGHLARFDQVISKLVAMHARLDQINGK